MPAPSAGRASDLVVRGGRIHTFAAAGDVAALAVRDGRVIAAGAETDIEPLIGSGTRILGLDGATVVPGFIESHVHPNLYGTSRLWVDCRTPPNDTIADVCARIAESAREVPPGEWIQGWAYDDTLLADRRHPTRHDLDLVAPDHPVLLWHASGHINVANTLALRRAGIDRDTPDEFEGMHGVIVKDPESGEPTGELRERGARNRVTRLLPKPSVQQMMDAIQWSLRDFASHGITTIHDAGVGILGGLGEVQAYRGLLEARRLPVRVVMMLREELVRDSPQDARRDLGFIERSVDERLKLGLVKVTQDGSIQGLSGALSRPYACDHTCSGVQLFDQPELNEKVAALHRAGFQVAVHANGDAAIDSVLDAFAAAVGEAPPRDHRHRIEHCQMAREDQLARMAALGVEASFFVKHVYYWGDRHRDIFLGPERASRISPLHSARGRGLHWSLHSDCPVTPPDPLFGVWCAVNRMTAAGDVLGAEQRVPVTTALAGYGRGAAHLAFDEGRMGTLEAGKLADFAVLDQDPLEVDPARLREIAVQATAVGGEPVFVAPGARLATDW